MCESTRDGRRVRQRTLVELGRLEAAVADEIEGLCKAAPCPRVQRMPIGAPLLVDALLRTTGADELLRKIGRRDRGSSLAPSLRLLVAGRLFGVASTAALAREQDRLRRPETDSPPLSYDNILRALGTLGDAAGEVERWLRAATQPADTVRLCVSGGFCSAPGADCPSLCIEADSADLLPLSLHCRDERTPDADVVARCEATADDTVLDGDTLVDMGHTRTILGRALLERVEGADRLDLACGGHARLVTGPDGERYALAHPPRAGEDCEEALLECVRAAEAALTQIERDVRTGKVRRASTIEARARRVIGEAHAWRWLEFQAAEGRFDWTRRSDRLKRDLAHAGEHVVRVACAKDGGPAALDAATSLSVLLRHDAGLVPISHRAPARIRGHLALSLLAAWLMRTLQLRLCSVGLDLSARNAIARADHAAALRFDLPSGPIIGRPPLGRDLSAALTAAGVDDPRQAVDEAMQALASQV